MEEEGARLRARAGGDSLASISGDDPHRYAREGGGRRHRTRNQLGASHGAGSELLRSLRAGDFARLESGRDEGPRSFLPPIHPKKSQAPDTSPRSVMDGFESPYESPRSPRHGGGGTGAPPTAPAPGHHEAIASLGESILASAAALTDKRVDDDLRREERRAARTLRRRHRDLQGGDLTKRPPTPLVRSASQSRIEDGWVPCNQLADRAGATGMQTFRGGDVGLLEELVGGAAQSKGVEGRVAALPPLARAHLVAGGSSRDAESYRRVQERRRAGIMRAASSLSRGALPTLSEE